MTTDITITGDEDGFILLQCHFCGEYFKLLVADIKDESNINIWCPYCGLNSRQYATEEVIETGMKIAKNEINELIYNAFKDLEKQTRNNKILKVKYNNKISKEEISAIKVKIENLEKKSYNCCNTVAKIRPISVMCGSYCPKCGGMNYE